MSFRTIVCCCVLLIAWSTAGAATEEPAQPVKITVYADSVINADYFRVFLVDSLIRNHETIGVISMPQLRYMFASSEYRKVKLMTATGREISAGEYAIDNDLIRLGRKDPVALPDVQSLVFLEKRDLAGAFIYGALNFFVVSGIAAVVEAVEKAKGHEYEMEKVLAYGGAFGLLGFVVEFDTTREDPVYFKFALPLMRER